VTAKRASATDESTNEHETTTATNSLDGSADGSMDGALSGASARVRRRISSGTLILGAVIVASGASLWTMRAIDRAAASGPKMSKEIEDLVKKALDPKAQTVAENSKPETFVSRTQPPTDLQVPAEEVQKNPFVVYQPPKSGGDSPPDGEQPRVPQVDLVAEWQSKVDAAAAAIRLQSTMSGKGAQGATGIANINGHMMRIGEIFGVEGSDIEFTLEQVERDAITVRAYNAELRHERLVTVNVAKRF
jgi:hypothetical protein